MKLLYLLLLLVCTMKFSHGKREKDNSVENSDSDNFGAAEEINNDEEEFELVEENDPKPLFFGSRRRRCSRRRAKTKPCTRSYNGCGSEKFSKVWFPFKSVFTASCNKHDVCYNCGGWRSWSRTKCDNQFFDDMQMTCTCKYKQVYEAIALKSCLDWATTLYRTVQGLGWNFYTGNKKSKYSWCKNSCVIPYGSPSYPE